jgi:hypothetical protein
MRVFCQVQALQLQLLPLKFQRLLQPLIRQLQDLAKAFLNNQGKPQKNPK